MHNYIKWARSAHHNGMTTIRTWKKESRRRGSKSLRSKSWRGGGWTSSREPSSKWWNKISCRRPMLNCSKTTSGWEHWIVNCCYRTPSRAGSSSWNSKPTSKMSRRRGNSTTTRKHWYACFYSESNPEARGGREEKEGRGKAQIAGLRKSHPEAA